MLTSVRISFCPSVSHGYVELDFVDEVRGQIPILKQKRNDMYEVTETKQ